GWQINKTRSSANVQHTRRHGNLRYPKVPARAVANVETFHEPVAPTDASATRVYQSSGFNARTFRGIFSLRNTLSPRDSFRRGLLRLIRQNERRNGWHIEQPWVFEARLTEPLAHLGKGERIARFRIHEHVNREDQRVRRARATVVRDKFLNRHRAAR